MSQVATQQDEPVRRTWRTLFETARNLFARPPRIQFAALCYRKRGKKKGGHEVLLITSRGSGRWVTPKGWPMEKHSSGQTAAQEAFEEAGIRGRIGRDPIGHFDYFKELKGGLPIRCRVQVHALEVTGTEKDFPEKNERRLSWFSPEEAAERVAEPGLKAIIRTFKP